MSQKILIVDDDIDTLQLVGTMLERQGFKIVAANNGEKALKIAQDEKPDLIILDVMMPGMDGYEVTRRLRVMESTAYIPIILFTAKTQVDDKVEGYESGADDYLTKPTHPAELIARVKTILNRPKTGALAADTQSSQYKFGALYGIMSAKGGLGVSTLALNLAVSIHLRTQEYVTLADFRQGYGTIGLQLGYSHTDSLSPLLNKKPGDIRLEDVEDLLVTHGSGIQLLLASYEPSQAALINKPDHFAMIAKHLSRISPYTIIDLGNGLNETSSQMSKDCSKLIVVVEPVPSTIIQTKALLANLIELEVTAENINIVLLNRIRLEISMPVNAVQEEIGLPIIGVITPAPEIAFQALSRHEPMILQQPGSIVSSQINKLADSITD